jgi:hypothetical protein
MSALSFTADKLAHAESVIALLEKQLNFLKDKQVYWPNSDGSFMTVEEILMEEFGP